MKIIVVYDTSACVWIGKQYVEDDGLWIKLKPGPCIWWGWRHQQTGEAKSQEVQSRPVFSKFTRRMTVFFVDWQHTHVIF